MFNEANNSLKSLRDLLRFAVSQFNEANLHYGHGSENAFDEAAYLILHTLNLPLNTLDIYLDAVVLPSEKTKILSTIKTRIETRLPIAYITKQAWQGDFEFYVDERVLIPRSFISELLGEKLSPWIQYDELIYRGLDLCTGSGCLAIQMAHYYPDAIIDAVDISLDALEVCAINIENYDLNNRIKMIHTDLFTGINENEKYELIVSNPPYVDQNAMENLPEEYLHEPSIALGSGLDGLDLTRKIISQAADHLSDNGVLVVEIGHNRDILEQEFPHLPFNWLETSGGDGFVFLLTHDDLLHSKLN